jgi:hypothetical protein
MKKIKWILLRMKVEVSKEGERRKVGIDYEIEDVFV